MLITFFALITPLLALIPPLQRNKFFILYFALMILSAYVSENHFFRVIAFSHKAFLIFVVYHLCCINLVTFVAYAADKNAARKQKWRIPEAHLHALEFLGGWIGAFSAQKIFRHKTKKRSYQAMFWLMLLLQGAAVYFILHYLKLIA